MFLMLELELELGVGIVKTACFYLLFIYSILYSIRENIVCRKHSMARSATA